MKPKWTSSPASLTLVRHAHSLGNHADAQARQAGAEELVLDRRDADVRLSRTGEAQAAGVAAWLARQGAATRPTVVASSPYVRADQTAHRVVGGLGLEVLHDERLRERDLGVLNGLTGVGMRARYPEEAERRRKVGKFYYQPPSGESWCDVALRVRSFLDDLRFGYDDEHVWLFTHQAVVMTFRYVLEALTEEQLLEIDRTEDLPNASLTVYRRSGDEFELVRFADTTAVDSTSEVTHEAPVGSETGRRT